MKRVFILLFLLCIASPARTQSLKIWTLADLSSQADIVCTGTPLKVDVIEEKKAEDLLNYTPPPPKRVTVARIKLVSKIKGDIPAEFEVHLPAPVEQPLSLDAEKTPPGIQLEQGKLYCFYLKRVDGELWYVSALSGGENEGDAIRGAEATPVLSKEDAVEIATMYYLKTDPKAVIEPGLTTTDLAQEAFQAWRVRFHSSQVVLSSNDSGRRRDYGSLDAMIIVNPDKSVDGGSVIFGSPGDEYNKALTGSRVELSVVTAHSGIPDTIRGAIQKTEPDAVTLLVDGIGNAPAKAETFPKALILRMRLLPAEQATTPAAQ